MQTSPLEQQQQAPAETGQPPVPDGPGPHDVPDDEVIEKTLPSR